MLRVTFISPTQTTTAYARSASLYSRALLVGHDARRKCRKTGHSWWRQCPFTYARMYSGQAAPVSAGYPGAQGAADVRPNAGVEGMGARSVGHSEIDLVHFHCKAATARSREQIRKAPGPPRGFSGHRIC